MVLIDKAVLEIEADANGDGTIETGVFEIETNVEVQEQMRTSFLLDNSLDRILGAIAKNNNDTGRAGITIDVGGGQTTHQISFTEADGGVNEWGDGSGTTESDGKGTTARQKKDVLMRYLKKGNFGSLNPIRFKFGAYHDNGFYETYIPCTVQSTRMTVDAEEESTLDGQITLVEVQEELDAPESAVGRGVP